MMEFCHKDDDDFRTISILMRWALLINVLIATVVKTHTRFPQQEA
jgi:hypothetical protein